MFVFIGSAHCARAGDRAVSFCLLHVLCYTSFVLLSLNLKVQLDNVAPLAALALMAELGRKGTKGTRASEAAQVQPRSNLEPSTLRFSEAFYSGLTLCGSPLLISFLF